MSERVDKPTSACPWCKSAEHLNVQRNDGDDRSVVCWKCCASGPMVSGRHSRKAAIAAWNQSAQPAAGSLAALRALEEYVSRFGGIDNGYCKECGVDRSFDTHGNRQPCANDDCLSNKAASALARYRDVR